MARRRLGVVVVIDGPVGTEIDGMRRGLGDPALERIVPHCTLVPPVNVTAGAFGEALGRLRLAAGRAAPIELTLGPPDTFLPVNPVAYLRVGGDLAALGALRDAVFAPPLARSLTWPWTPHVTLADGVAPERIYAACRGLDRYVTTTVVDRVVLLEERRGDSGRRWEEVADATLGAPSIVGRGGLQVTLHAGRLIDPEALALLSGAGIEADPTPLAATAPAVAVTARTDAGLAGVAQAWRDSTGSHVGVFVAPSQRRCGIGAHLLAAMESRLRAASWGAAELVAHGPAGFYRARSSWARPAGRETLTRMRPRSTEPAS